MKPFQFRLEPVLRLKSRLLEKEESALQELMRDERALEKQIEEVISDSHRQARFLVDARDLRGEILCSYAGYQQNCKARILDLSATLSECRREQAVRRNRILELHQERELIEKLKAKQLAEWTYLANKEIDELAHEAFLNRITREMSSKRSSR